MIRVVIDEKDFNISDEIALINKCFSIGAVASFIGLVRNYNDNSLQSMYIECYISMAQKMLTKIANEARNRWQVNDVLIYHRIGKLMLNEQIVLVITTAKHRKNALSSCQFIVDYLKTDAPFWKKEHTEYSSNWVQQNKADIVAKNQWF